MEVSEARLRKIEHRQVGLGKDIHSADHGLAGRLAKAEGMIQVLENQLFLMSGRLIALEEKQK